MNSTQFEFKHLFLWCTSLQLVEIQKSMFQFVIISNYFIEIKDKTYWYSRIVAVSTCLKLKL